MYENGEGLSDRQVSVERQILRDFYLSFQFSQGFAPFQSVLHGEVAGYYSLTWDAARVKEARGVLPRLAESAKHLALPKEHTQFEPEQITRELSSEWRFFESRLRLLVPNTRPAHVVQETRMLGIAQTMASLVARDVQYVESGRPKTRTDPYLSYVREYVILGKDTGSEAYNDLFSHGLEILASPAFQAQHYTEFYKLTNAWQAKHPGEQFWP